MCLAIPGQIKKILTNPNYAIVDFSGVETKINIELIRARVNDWIIVHAGFAIEKLNEQEAKDTLKLISTNETRITR